MNSVRKAPDEAQLDSESAKTGRALAGQEKRTVRIPRLGTPQRPEELDDIPVPVTVNGYTFLILRGQAVEVPQSVAEILEESGYLY